MRASWVPWHAHATSADTRPASLSDKSPFSWERGQCGCWDSRQRTGVVACEVLRSERIHGTKWPQNDTRRCAAVTDLQRQSAEATTGAPGVGWTSDQLSQRVRHNTMTAEYKRFLAKSWAALHLQYAVLLQSHSWAIAHVRRCFKGSWSW